MFTGIELTYSLNFYKNYMEEAKEGYLKSTSKSSDDRTSGYHCLIYL